VGSKVGKGSQTKGCRNVFEGDTLLLFDIFNSLLTVFFQLSDSIKDVGVNHIIQKKTNNFATALFSPLGKGQTKNVSHEEIKEVVFKVPAKKEEVSEDKNTPQQNSFYQDDSDDDSD
jgi:hypothetical protein